MSEPGLSVERRNSPDRTNVSIRHGVAGTGTINGSEAPEAESAARTGTSFAALRPALATRTTPVWNDQADLKRTACRVYSSRLTPLGLWMTCCVVLGGGGQLAAEEITVPVVVDANLQLTLLASEPEIVTPTGLAADREGRLYVVESHTHARGPDYDGPASDRILVFEDTDGSGVVDQSRVYADGLRNALTIAFDAGGKLYAVQMKSVVRLCDTDNDGRCELREPVLTIETDNNNNHGVFLGIAFDNQDRMHVSLGNIGGIAYVIEGSDGVRIAGQGDTGLIVRCHADGSSLERFAQGFWNPPEMRFDAAGRLLATDNDPDARGPNRVLHVIQGGDYGYRSRFGGSGLHPYCAWNGELPGTLPMIAGVGEAPVGLLDCAQTSLPQDYTADLLVSVWGTNEVVRVRTTRRGASLAGRVEPLIVGDSNFRPTSITSTADGTVYIADWADRRYPVHGKGRIWRLSAKPGVDTLDPVLPSSRAAADAGESALAALGTASSPAAFDRPVSAATDPDPFLSHTAIHSLSGSDFRNRVLQLLEAGDPPRRMAALLALRLAGVEPDAAGLRRLLNDRDADIRKMSLIWIGEAMRMDLAADVRQSLPLQTDSAGLFETFLATSQLLTGEELARVEAQTPVNRIDRSVDQDLIQAVIADDELPARARATAVRYLTKVDGFPTTELLTRLAQADDLLLAGEAIRTLAGSQSNEVARILAAIACDPERDVALRCDAIMSFVASEKRNVEDLLALVSDSKTPISLTTVRGLTSSVERQTVRAAFHSSLSAGRAPQKVADQLQFALQRATGRPQNDEQWKTALATGGDPDAGRRVFFDRRVTCSRCHRVEGRGGRIGPDLSNIAAGRSRAQILDSILNPSRDRSPDYQGYLVVMQDGRVHKGTQFHYRGESAELLLEDGTQFRFRLNETEEYRPLDESLMPDRLEETMSVTEFRDLLAYLSTPGAAGEKCHGQIEVAAQSRVRVFVCDRFRRQRRDTDIQTALIRRRRRRRRLRKWRNQRL